MWQHSTVSTQAPHGAIHVPQCPRDMFAGSLNRILEEPVPVYAQSDTVFRACLQLQKYLIEPISRPISVDMHPAELHATHCLSTGEANWADLLRIAQLLPQQRQSRFPQYAPVGELAPASFTTGACARGPNVGITRNMKDYPRVTQVLAMIIQAIDPEHRFSSCTLSLNTGASAHRDSHNARSSSNLLVPCSIFEGGGIWLQNGGGSVRLESAGPLGSILPKLGSAVAFPGNWFKFEYSAPNRLNAGAEHQYVGFHGTHLECLHAIISTGRLLPSDPGIPGTPCLYRQEWSLPP